jgi:hypothetical protein
MLNKSKLKEKNDERMYIDDDLQKKLRKIQINGEWFRWDERERRN